MIISLSLIKFQKPHWILWSALNTNDSFWICTSEQDSFFILVTIYLFRQSEIMLIYCHLYFSYTYKHLGKCLYQSKQIMKRIVRGSVLQKVGEFRDHNSGLVNANVAYR